jgi:hypothetical protein
MKIKKETTSISKQISSSKIQREYLLKELDDLESKVKDEFNFLKGMLTYATQTFTVKCIKKSADKVDRTSSMLTGPLFTSQEYPIPNDGNQMLFPVLQVDLRELSSLANENIGDGLLQLWCDISRLDCIIRVIPREKVLLENIDPFAFEVPKLDFQGENFEGFPLPIWYNLDPSGDSIDVIDYCIPGPFESQLAGYESDYGRYINQLIFGDFKKDLVKFAKTSEPKTFENITFFGVHPVIQYNCSDTNAFCLLSISDWGSSGSAEIFYKLNPGGETEFTFFSSVR